jgi:hypothetical protein
MYRTLLFSSLNNSAPPSVLSFDGFYAFGKELVSCIAQHYKVIDALD